MTDATEPAVVPLVVPEERGLPVLRQLDLTKLPDGAELAIRLRKTSTGRWRCRLDVGNEKAQHELGDRVMTLDDLLVDLHVFASENMAAAVLRQQASGAGKQL